MPLMFYILIGFLIGLSTMAIISLYKWALKYWQDGFY